MSNQQKPRVHIPDSLRDILLEFSIAYLLEQPGDVVDYAVDFFTKLQESRKSKQSHDDVPVSPDESELMSLDEGECATLTFNAIYPQTIARKAPVQFTFAKNHSINANLAAPIHARYGPADERSEGDGCAHEMEISALFR